MEKALASLPKVSRKKFEELLIDIQLQLNVSTRLIENEEEMALLIHQYTRALGLLPSKLEKRQDATKVEWFISSDSRDTVKVDKDGNGLKRLWQQQLCQFTLMSLESAEAITTLYKSPLQLMEVSLFIIFFFYSTRNLSIVNLIDTIFRLIPIVPQLKEKYY